MLRDAASYKLCGHGAENSAGVGKMCKVPDAQKSQASPVPIGLIVERAWRAGGGDPHGKMDSEWCFGQFSVGPCKPSIVEGFPLTEKLETRKIVIWVWLNNGCCALLQQNCSTYELMYGHRVGI